MGSNPTPPIYEKKMKLSRHILLAIFILSVVSCSNGGKYVNREANYEIMVPHGWHVVPHQDLRSVSFTKYSTQKYGNSVISLRVDSIRFESPMEQLESELLPAFLAANESENTSMQVVDGPQTVSINGKSWAMVKCYDGSDKILRIYVTFSNKNSFAIILFSAGQKRIEDEKIFLTTINSLSIHN